MKRWASLFNIRRADIRYFRLVEVAPLFDGSTKAQEQLGWGSGIAAHEVCAEMVIEDHKPALCSKFLKKHGMENSVPLKN